MKTFLSLATIIGLLLFAEPATAQPEPTEGLSSSEASVRFAAIQALPAGPLPAATLTKLQQLAIDDMSPAIRSAACTALGERLATAETTLPILIRACRDQGEYDNDQFVYQSAGAALAKYKGASIPLIQKMLASDDAEEVRGAGFALEYVGPWAAPIVPQLIPILKRQDSRTVVGAINAVIRIGPPAASTVPALIKLLDHENFHIRYWTCRALRSVGADAADAAPRLIETLEQDGASVRKHAAAALGGIGPAAGEKAVAALAKALNDPLQPVQAAAAAAIGDLMPISKASQSDLEAILEKPSFKARAEAAMSLWKMEPGSERAKQVLIEQLNDKQSPFDAVEVIATMGNEMELGADVSAALQSETAIVRECAALSLSRMGAGAAPQLEALRKAAASDTDPDVREIAAAAVEAIEQAVAEKKQEKKEANGKAQGS